MMNTAFSFPLFMPLFISVLSTGSSEKLAPSQDLLSQEETMWHPNESQYCNATANQITW